MDNGHEDSQTKKAGCDPAYRLALARQPHAQGNEGAAYEKKAKSAGDAWPQKKSIVSLCIHATQLF